MKRRRSTSGLCGAALVAALGCTVSPSPSPGPTIEATEAVVLPSARPAPTARAGPTAKPFEPASPIEQIADLPSVDPARTSASVKLDGVRLTVSVESTSIAGGDSIWADLTLENLGRGRLRWYPEGCGLPLWVRAEMPFAWTYGQDQPLYMVFKQWFLNKPQVGAPLPSERFPIPLGVTEEGSGPDCPNELGAGASMQGRWLLNATTSFAARQGPEHAIFEHWLPPAGPVELIASFGLWSRGNEDIEEVDHPTVEVRLPLEVIGGRDTRLIAPGQAFDIALTAPELRSVLWTYRRIDELRSTLLSLDEGAKTWTVGVTYVDNDVHHALTVTVDGIAASVIRVVAEP
jgi:hypothetical protein